MSQFVQYVFWRLDSVFHNLESNERLVAKQGFLGAWESFQSRAMLLSYSLTGMRADCDVLCVRAADSLETLQDMTCRVQSSGMGKFLMPTYSYLAEATGPRFDASGKDGFAPGKGRYLFFSPWVGGERSRAADESLAKAAESRGFRLHPGLRSMEEAEELVAVETDRPGEHAAFASELKRIRGEALTSAGPAFVAILKDIRDLVDCLG